MQWEHTGFLHAFQYLHFPLLLETLSQAKVKKFKGGLQDKKKVFYLILAQIHKLRKIKRWKSC